MARDWRRRFAVRSVLWRHYLDFGVSNVPFYLRTITLFFWIIFFYFFAAPARRAVLRNLRVVLPGSSWLLNQVRAWLTLYNFAWTIADAADYKLARTEFAYEVEGEEFLDQLASAHGAILLTAHLGNYDLGAVIFAQRYQREIRMVRAPESDQQTAQHLDRSLERAGEGAVKVAYNTSSMALPLDMLNAIRAGEIVSIQGDRPVPNVSQRATRLFGEVVRLPDGPFMLALVAQVPIFPVFIVRTAFHRYKIIAHAPIHCLRVEREREATIEAAMQVWSRTLEQVIAEHWSQWFSLVPIFSHAMKAVGTRPLGYAFSLSRLVVRLTGRKARRAEFSGAEAWGLGLLVFGISFIFVARALLPLVRPKVFYLVVLFVLPFAIWIAFLLLYYLNSLVIALLRRLGLYSAVTNNPFQHVVIMSLTSLIALHFLLGEPVWIKSLGIFWLGLLSLNLLLILVEKLLDEA